MGGEGDTHDNSSDDHILLVDYRKRHHTVRIPRQDVLTSPYANRIKARSTSN